MGEKNVVGLSYSRPRTLPDTATIPQRQQKESKLLKKGKGSKL